MRSEQATVEFVAEDRKIESLGVFYDQLTPAQLDALASVAMDMWEPYIRATCTRLPAADARVVFDRFHIMREMTKAVDTVRKQEHQTFLRHAGASPLTKTKYLWLFSEECLPDGHAETFATVQAWNSRSAAPGQSRKPCGRCGISARTRPPAASSIAGTTGRSRSRIDPVKKVAATLKRHRNDVLRFVKHPITNGVAEGLNSKIMSIKRKAAGFRSAQNFTTATYFHCGGLNLYPR